MTTPGTVRRRVVLGASWATPAVMIGAAAPLAAASPCPVTANMTYNATNWSLTETTAAVQQGSASFNTDRIVVNTDPKIGMTYTATATKTFTFAAGNFYTFEIPWFARTTNDVPMTLTAALSGPSGNLTPTGSGALSLGSVSTLVDTNVSTTGGTVTLRYGKILTTATYTMTYTFSVTGSGSTIGDDIILLAGNTLACSTT